MTASTQWQLAQEAAERYESLVRAMEQHIGPDTAKGFRFVHTW